MRIISVVSALSGALALIMLALLRHAAPQADYSAVLTAGLAHLSAAAAGLALAGRRGRVNLIAAALILAGANVFAGVIYASALVPGHPLQVLAPIGGALQILGWITLAFGAPERR